ncbi:MAG: glycerate kinase [Ignavibacteriales bacterium]|nr:glycerate kinase [Ignavibacteriales bacterium]MCF8305042.1 glycerate kinase [Ignavibacteriales bacterium]MCF8314731.1 glycerate kinase [Ignavibacteriales bacterium]MCF8438021.1 glycerate kinase [Ignavibacteriales bacterium]
MNICIALNSFKGCADSVSATNQFAGQFKQAMVAHGYNDITISQCPLSDGGDGFLRVICYYYGFQEMGISIASFSKSGENSVKYLEDAIGKKIYIESADLVGLNLFSNKNRSILKRNSSSLGVMLKKLNDLYNGEFEFVIGIGGTGTNDLGIGALSEFGLKISDKYGKLLDPIPENFPEIHSIFWDYQSNFPKITLVLDVSNPLTGQSGAARVFGPQKGADEREVEILESGAEQFLRVYSGLSKVPDKLSGAGGGLAAGLILFFNACTISFREFLSSLPDIENKVALSDIVITGEGKLDSQSKGNKAAGWVIEKIKESKKKGIFITGSSEVDFLSENFIIFKFSDYFPDIENSISEFERALEIAAREIANIIIMDRS